MQTIRQRLHALLLLAALTISLAVPASAAGSLPFTDVDPRSGTTPTYKTSTTPAL